MRAHLTADVKNMGKQINAARHRCEPDPAGAAEAACLHAKSMVDVHIGAAKGPAARFEPQVQHVGKRLSI